MTPNATNILPNVAELLPHAGAMVLLDRVCHWDQDTILCQALSHTDPQNPLRCNGRLSIYNGVEYAAQAMAAHAKLVTEQQQAPRKGFLATASKIVAHTERLDTIQAPLDIQAQRMVDGGDSSLYQFTIKAGADLLLEGQLMVVKQGSQGTSEQV